MENDASLILALQYEMCDGFGFQVEPERKCIYVAQCFKPTSEEERAKEPWRRVTEMPQSALIHEFIPADKIWITDYLGREFVTVHIAYFQEIERLFNTLLENGYWVLTHTTPQAYFKTGDRFSREQLDHKIMATWNDNFNQFKQCNKTDDQCYEFLENILYTDRLMRLDNWATPEGRAFCVKLREHYRYRGDDRKSRYEKDVFIDACTKNSILFKGGWYAYEPHLLQYNSPPKRIKKEEEDECMICLDAPADTLVLPCEHKVVCGACSRALRNTNDAKTCVRCRRPIEWVSYGDNNEMETKLYPPCTLTDITSIL